MTEVVTSDMSSGTAPVIDIAEAGKPVSTTSAQAQEQATVLIHYPGSEILHIDSLDIEAQGVGRRPDGKVVFVEGALPGEAVTASTFRRKGSWERATLMAIHQESAQRVEPGCPHFGLHTGACGGCRMQHLHIGAQVAVKQRILEDNLQHIGKVQAAQVLRPIEGPAWGYRFRARLSVRYVRKKEKVLVGFHERKSHYVADMQVCPVLPSKVEALLLPLRSMIAGMAARETLPQIELACGDEVVALVLRHLEPLCASDLEALRAFAQEHEVQWWLQSKGPETVRLLDPQDPARPSLSYALPEFDVVMPFRPTDFTQVNPFINRVLVAKALKLLDVQQNDRVIDWFCGLGNFTLPLATLAASVLGIEGSEALVERASENFQRNSAASHTRQALAATKFVARDLFQMTGVQLVADGAADRWLIDPPREGAFSLVKALADLAGTEPDGAESDRIPDEQRSDTAAFVPVGDPVTTTAQQKERVDQLQAAQSARDQATLVGWFPPRRIVYVSCNPATLARDAEVLVHRAGYRLSAAGVVNMFSHTAHIESIAVFDLISPANLPV